MHRALPLFLCLLAAYPAAAQAPLPVGLGIGKSEYAPGCFAGPAISRMGTKVILVDVTKKQVINARLERTACSKAATYRMPDSPHHLNLTLPEDSDYPVGLVFPAATTIGWAPYPTATYNGRTYGIGECTSHEGAHLTVWEGEPYKSKLINDAYYYAGYDTQANCPNLPLVQ